MSYERSRVTNARTTTTGARRPLGSPTPATNRSYVPASSSRDHRTTATNATSAATNLAGGQHDLSHEQLAEIKEAFDIFDADHDGALDHHELKVAMRALGFDVHRADVTALITQHDQRGNRLLYYEDFKAIMTEKMLHRDPLDEIKRAFKLFDEEDTGRISLKNLKRVARDLNESIDEQELAAMIEEFDLDGDGEISLEEFIAIMRDEQ